MRKNEGSLEVCEAFLAIAVIILIIGFSNAYCQDITLPREQAVEALRALKENPDLRSENEAFAKEVDALKKEIAKLEAAQLTPCILEKREVERTIKVAQDLFIAQIEKVVKLNLSEKNQSKAVNLEIKLYEKRIKSIEKRANKSVAKQCNYEMSKSLFQKVINFGEKAAPVIITAVIIRQF